MAGMSHIPEDRHKHGLILGFTLEQNLVLQRVQEKQFQNHGFIRFDNVREYANRLIDEYDIRSGQGSRYCYEEHVRRKPAESHNSQRLDRKRTSHHSSTAHQGPRCGSDRAYTQTACSRKR